jgi:hypothetical protein
VAVMLCQAGNEAGPNLLVFALGGKEHPLGH